MCLVTINMPANGLWICPKSFEGALHSQNPHGTDTGSLDPQSMWF